MTAFQCLGVRIVVDQPTASVYEAPLLPKHMRPRGVKYIPYIKQHPMLSLPSFPPQPLLLVYRGFCRGFWSAVLGIRTCITPTNYHIQIEHFHYHANYTSTPLCQQPQLVNLPLVLCVLPALQMPQFAFRSSSLNSRLQHKISILLHEHPVNHESRWSLQVFTGNRLLREFRIRLHIEVADHSFFLPC